MLPQELSGNLLRKYRVVFQVKNVHGDFSSE
jgi:hypothetical protein